MDTNGSFQYRQQLVAEAQQAYADPVRQAMYYDQYSYLQSVLDRNDRMTMGASIECREPFLDFRIMEWAASVPTAALFNNGIGKFAMRSAYRELLPATIINHKKWGFAAPFTQYFRTVPSLRKWVERLSEMEVFETCPLSRAWIASVTIDFLKGNDQLAPIVRQLILIAAWYSVCIRGESNIFNG